MFRLLSLDLIAERGQSFIFGRTASVPTPMAKGGSKRYGPGFNDSDFASTATKELADPVTLAVLELDYLGWRCSLWDKASHSPSDPKPNWLRPALAIIAPNPAYRARFLFAT